MNRKSQKKIYKINLNNYFIPNSKKWNGTKGNKIYIQNINLKLHSDKKLVIEEIKNILDKKIIETSLKICFFEPTNTYYYPYKYK